MGEICDGAGQACSCPVTRILKSVVGPIDFASKWLMIINMTVMSVLVVMQVVLRYFFSLALDWADEISRLTFVWSMFLSIPHGVKAGSHVGIDTIVYFLPPDIREYVTRGALFFCAVLSLVVFYFGIGVTMEKWQELMPTVDLTAAVYYIPLLIAMAHSFIHLMVLVVGGSKAWHEEKKT